MQVLQVFFLQGFIKILQENYLAIFSYKIVARFFVFCKIYLVAPGEEILEIA